MRAGRRRKRTGAFSWLELVVTIAVISILAWLALPKITVGPGRGFATQTLSNMKQLHMAAKAMAEDGEIARDKTLGWPGDTGGTFTNWSARLVPAYLSTNDLCKLLSAPGKVVSPQKLTFGMRESGVLVYAVRGDSPTDVTFLTSANFTNSPQGGNTLESTARPYGNKCFVVFRKGGDGAVLQKNQAGRTNLVGAYAPLLK